MVDKPQMLLINSKQGRTSYSFHPLGFMPHTDWKDLKKLWEAAKLFLWSCLFPASGTLKT